MTHFTAPSFWELYDKLPEPIQELADKNYKLLKTNPRHPSLQLKKVGKYWSVRVGLKYRAVAVEIVGPKSACPGRLPGRPSAVS
ncbi:MAG: hypothetical protein ABIL11_11430 [Chloroflexota bacterium]